jgi:signal transduction histidine kinase
MSDDSRTFALADERLGTVLVVDDQPENVQLLFDLLTEEGYKVLVATSGRAAVERARYALPDIVLLDVMMPDMDGWEACERLASDPETSDIPVVFMTALTGVEEKVRAFGLGAADYVTKPLQHQEVLARVATQVRLSRLRAALLVKNSRLDGFARMVAHDLKTPLSSVRGFSELLLRRIDAGADPASLRQSASMILDRADRMGEIIEALLVLAEVAGRAMPVEAVDLDALVRRVLAEDLDVLLSNTGGRVLVEGGFGLVTGYAPWLRQVLSNLVGNALVHSGAPESVSVVGSVLASQFVRCSVRDRGRGVGLEGRAALFETTGRESVGGHGLGLWLVRQIVERLGGRVGAEFPPSGGATFYFDLPIAESAKDADRKNRCPGRQPG